MPRPEAGTWPALGRSVSRTAALLAHGRLRRPDALVGETLRFADGTAGRVYRETVLAGSVPADPCVLVVAFRLRRVRGRGHVVFEAESLLNTPLFAGFPGFVSKLWLRHDEHDVYRGVYEWDGPDRAEAYARAVGRVLALVSEPGSVDHRVLAGLRRDQLLAAPWRLAGFAPFDAETWWRLVSPPRVPSRRPAPAC